MQIMTNVLMDNYRNWNGQVSEIVSFFSHLSIFTEIIS